MVISINIGSRQFGFSLFSKRAKAPLTADGKDIHGSSLLSGIFGGGSSSGVRVTSESALTLSSWFSCIRVISEDLGSLPVNLYEKQDNRRRIISENRRHRLVHDEPNAFMPSNIFFETMTAAANMWGNAYAYIHRNANDLPIELEIFHPTTVRPFLYNNKLFYQVDGIENSIRARNMLHIPGFGFNGIMGLSPITYHRESIGTGLAAQQFANTFYKNGGALEGVYETEQVLDDTVYDQIMTRILKHQGLGNQHKNMILEGGLKYKQIGVNPDDAQFLETRKYSRTEIAGIFRVSPHLIGDLENSNYNSNEEATLRHVQYTIRPWAVRFEKELNRKLLRPSDRSRQYFKFNLTALLRGDMKTRAEYYTKMIALGYSHNDILELEDRNPVEGGNRRFVPSNLVPLDRVDDWMNSKLKDKNPDPSNQKQNNE